MFQRAALAAALVALVAHSAAAPLGAEFEGSSAGFTITEVASPEKVLISGPVEVEKAYRKFNKPVPANVAAAAAAAVTSGSVVATPQSYDTEYLIPVTVGGQSLTLDLDTGSSDFWVFSSLQPSSQRSGHKIYTPSGSPVSGETWKISYGDGSGANGVVYLDKVTIGGVTATSQAVEAAQSASSSFVSNTAVSGLAGFAFPNINTCSPSQCTPFFQRVMSGLASKVFTSSLKKGKAGTYDLGYIDSSKYTGSIAYTSINTANGFWEFTSTGYAVGSTSYTASLDTIMDTGTTLVYMPNAVINNYYSKVSGAYNSANAGGIIFPCTSTLPSLSFTIGGVSKTIPGSYINFAPYSGSYCFGGLQSSSGIGINILGDIFIKSQFIVFDVGNTRLGVATPSSL